MKPARTFYINELEYSRNSITIETESGSLTIETNDLERAVRKRGFEFFILRLLYGGVPGYPIWFGPAASINMKSYASDPIREINGVVLTFEVDKVGLPTCSLTLRLNAVESLIFEHL